MNSAPLIDRARFEIKLGSYAVGTSTMLANSQFLALAQDYRRKLSSLMVPLDRFGIAARVPAAEYLVSRKVDGEFALLVVSGEDAFSINPGGTVRIGLPWIEEARKQLNASGVTQAVIAGEFYAETPDRRTRVHDVVATARQPKNIEDLERLRFAVFDIVSLENRPSEEAYSTTWQSILQLFSDGTLVRPVECRKVKTASEIESLFDSWVEAEGAEGLVARSSEAGVFKIKPRILLDAVVLGFTESGEERQGMIHDLLVGVMRDDGTIQVLTRVGGGFTEELRRRLLSDFKDHIVPSEYAEVNSDHVAYQMVRPDWIIEISCLDLISQSTRGGTINRMVIDFHDGKYQPIRRLPLATVISPQFVRFREEKRAHPADVSIRQISQRVDVPQADVAARDFAVPKSSMLRREVFTKQLKGETMVRKFVLLKTNKEAISDEFPAYVVHFTDYSPNRKEPLLRDVCVTQSPSQAQLLYDAFKEEHVKKGWTPHSGVVATAAEAEASTATPSARTGGLEQPEAPAASPELASEGPIEKPKRRRTPRTSPEIESNADDEPGKPAARRSSRKNAEPSN